MRTIACTCVAALVLACSEGAPPPLADAGPDRAALHERALGIFGALPDEAASPDNPVTDEKITLGRMLYYDARLSRNQDVSCNTCHDLAKHGIDAGPTSVGHRGQRGDRNVPTVYNAALHLAQFWDGRAADVEEQAKGPVLSSVERAMPDEATVLVTLRSIPDYAPLFQAAFPGEEDPIRYDNIARAIGAFERRLLTPSRFDAFLEGQDSALSDEELEGLALFMDTGCTSCHMGAPVGGLLYQKLGLVTPYPTADPGRAKLTGEPTDEGVFKVPSLRNVAETAPYFHDGSIATLPETVRIMARHQLGRELDDAQLQSIVTFLRSLTGTLDPEYIAMPELPASGPETPQPGQS
jgi:cytochrome c peroxidase